MSFKERIKRVDERKGKGGEAGSLEHQLQRAK